jgi:hypothetical protein
MPEMRFFLEDLAAFTPELINRLRKQVLSRFRKWTVVPQYEDQTFTVSPNGVQFNKHIITTAIRQSTEAYQQWLQGARKCDERIRGPLRRQFRYVVPLLPAAIRQVRKSKVVVLAAFDRFVPNIWKGRPVVWVLTQGGKKEPVMTPGQGQLTHVVFRDGVVEPSYCEKYWPRTEVQAPFFLHVHEFSWRNRHRLEVKLPGFVDEPDKLLGIVQVDELIRDADLKAQQG